MKHASMKYWVRKGMILFFTAVTPSFAATESYTIKGEKGELFRLQLDKNKERAELYPVRINEPLPPSVELRIRQKREPDIELNLKAQGPPGQPPPVYSGRLQGWSGSYASITFEVRWKGINGKRTKIATSENE